MKRFIFSTIFVLAMFIGSQETVAANMQSSDVSYETTSVAKENTHVYKFKIVNEANQPMLGVTIVYKQLFSSNVGTVTDLDGNAIIVVDDDKPTFIISFVGYKTIEITVTGTNEITLRMTPDAEASDPKN